MVDLWQKVGSESNVHSFFLLKLAGGGKVT